MVGYPLGLSPEFFLYLVLLFVAFEYSSFDYSTYDLDIFLVLLGVAEETSYLEIISVEFDESP